MHTHNSTHIPSQVPSTRRNSQILCGVEPISINHEIAVILVYDPCFTPIPVVEKLR